MIQCLSNETTTEILCDATYNPCHMAMFGFNLFQQRCAAFETLPQETHDALTKNNPGGGWVPPWLPLGSMAVGTDGHPSDVLSALRVRSCQASCQQCSFLFGSARQLTIEFGCNKGKETHPSRLAIATLSKSNALKKKADWASGSIYNLLKKWPHKPLAL